MTDLPVIIDKSGLQPRSPADIRTDLTNRVAATNPGYTNNLPAALIEDIASTDTASIALMEAARVETVDSLTPYGANDFLLNQLGGVYGIPLGGPSNTSVSVVFTTDPPAPGWAIPQGFTVSDGTHQYALTEGTIIRDDGTSPAAFCLATDTGSWAVPQDTVTQLVTQPPSTINLTLNNPSAGTPGGPAETAEQYRARVLQGGISASTGMLTTLKTALGQVSGVQQRLISVKQVTDGFNVIVGGGDPYEVANAIFLADFWLPGLLGSVINIVSISQANPAVVTTGLNHGLTSGETTVLKSIVGMSALNDNPYVATVLNPTQFTIPVDTTGFPAYGGSGYVTPNDRNIVVSINDFPDTYLVNFVAPPQQNVTMTVDWNTTSPNFVSQAAVAQLGSVALADYVNAIQVGNPINLLEASTAFQQAIVSVLDPALLTRLAFVVSIDGVGSVPLAGTSIIPGDALSYFTTTVGSINVVQA